MGSARPPRAPRGCDERESLHVLRRRGRRPPFTPTRSEPVSGPKSQVLRGPTAQAQPPFPRKAGEIRSQGKVRRKGCQDPPPCHHVEGGVGNVTACAGGGAPVARGRGGGAQRSAVRRSRLLLGREAGQAAERCGSQPDGEVALAAAVKYPWGGQTNRRTTEAGAGSRAGRPKVRAGQAQRRPLCPLNEVPAPLSPDPGAFPARWTVSPAASVSSSGETSPCSGWEPCSFYIQPRPCSPPCPSGWQ